MNALNLSGKIDRISVAVYSDVDQAAKELNIPYVVVGASARDLILHYGYGVRIIKATADIDFGFYVNGWDNFEKLRQHLIKSGFRETNTQHRLLCGGMKIDLVPFGAVQDSDAIIAWPPDGDVVIKVLGFQEALNNCIDVIIKDNPEVRIPVVMPPGLSLLKLISWSDRRADLKSKDAQDLRYLMKSYQEIPGILDSLYDYQEFEKIFDYDIDLGSAFKLGVEAGAIATQQTKAYLKRIENDQIEKRTCNMLVEDMCNIIEEEFSRNRTLLEAYFRGVNRFN